MSRALSRVAFLVLLAGALAGCATSGPPVAAIGPLPGSSGPSNPAAGALTPVPSMPSATDAAVTPAGFVSFCMRLPDQCANPTGGPTDIALTPDLMKTLDKVNKDVNDAIWPEEDEQHYGRAEYWTIPTDGYGDCEDFALTKRRNLIALGVPIGALRIAVVITERDTRHAVLDVVTDKGDFVLDNLNDDVLPWNRTGFRWIERQDPRTAMGWVSLLPADRQLASTDGAMVTSAAQ
jgi:predicted transglutaminase-like cysteine proteinase